MGKHGGNTGKASKKVKPNTPGKNSSGQSLPSFDENALTALTDKIEKGFHKEKNPDSVPRSPKGNKSSAKSKKSNPASRANGVSLGKKRDAEGNVKTPTKSASGTEHKSKLAEDGATGNTSSRDVLLQEILALGGTEEDLDLLDGVESDGDDIEGEAAPASNDPKFAKDLSKFIAGLGIDGQANAEPSDSGTDEAESAESEEWEDESVHASKGAEEPIPKLVQIPERKQQKQSKDINRLVSSPFNIEGAVRLTEM